jgi:hypothetical protein
MSPEILGPALTFAVSLWCRTLRYSHTNYEFFLAARSQGPAVFSLWHDELFAPCYLHRWEGLIAVVSQSRDGEILARVLERLGYRLARGSSTREGLRAVRQALALLREFEKDVVLTVDGPKGPRHVVKEGAVYLAHKAGVPLVPVRVVVSRAKCFHKAWDRFQLPLPGARCEIRYGRPYTIEVQKMDAARLKVEQARLQRKMEELKPD